ncbi:MAG: hypothetical protein EA353_11175 [Puniceicoccaceae bacterium]|nr:MAG: hypothetical protein EA353_11175 [Puniceicoccaceae bacterium]
MKLKITRPLNFGLIVALLLFLVTWRVCGWGDENFVRSFIVNFGYWLTLILLGVFVASLVFAVRSFFRPNDQANAQVMQIVRQHWLALLMVVVISAMMHSNGEHRFRTQNDEFGLLATSQMAHKYKTLALPHRMFYFNNQAVYIGHHTDIRLPLFAVSASLIHDLSGYRSANMFILNGLLTPVFLLLLYALAYRVSHSRQLGALALLLAFSVPLLSQVATSGGYDLLNVTLIVGLALVALSYAKNATAEKQTLLIYAGLLLAFCRYESVLYLIVPAFLIGRNWLKQQKIELRLIDALSPIFLALPICYNLYYTRKDSFTAPKIGEEVLEFFGVKYLPGNFGEAIDYFFFDPIISSTSVLVATFGLISVVYLFAHILTHFRKGVLSTFVISFTPVILVVFSILMLVLVNYWGQLTDYQAVRFALPVFVGLIPIIIWCIHHNKLNGRKCMFFWLGLSGFYCMAFSIPSQVQQHTSNSMIPSFGREFVTQFAREHGTQSTLFISQATLGLIAHGIPAVPPDFADANPDRIIAGYHYGHYDFIFTDHIITFDRNSETFVVNTSLGSLGEDYRLESVQFKRYAPLLKFHIARVVAIRNSKGEWIDLNERPTPVFEADVEDSVSLELFKKLP